MTTTFQSALLAQSSRGNIVLPLRLDFTDVVSIATDLSDQIQNGLFDFVQSVFIDNSQNVSGLTMTFDDTTTGGYRIAVQAGQQGWFPVPVPLGLCRFVTGTGQGNIIPIKLANCMMPYFVWPSALIGNVNANLTPIIAPFNDNSIAAMSGASELALAANAARKRMIIYNPGGNDTVLINFGAAASAVDSIPIYSGQSFDSQSGPVSGQDIFIQGTAGQTLIVKEA